jgi:hypothetical protein
MMEKSWTRRCYTYVVFKEYGGWWAAFGRLHPEGGHVIQLLRPLHPVQLRPLYSIFNNYKKNTESRKRMEEKYG